MMDSVEKLRKIDFENATSDDVRDVLNTVIFPALNSEILEGTYIVRARRGDGYTKRSQMTYCPVDLCTSLQRATLAGQTMFYGVISDNQSHLENARAISTAECSKLTRGGIESIGREKFTLSYWLVVKPLNIVSFIADTTYSEVQNNELLKHLRDAFCQLHLSEKDKSFIRFISDEFSKVVTDSREYLISATIASDLINKSNIDGIIFPSVQLGGQAGLNIALSPRAVNSKLRFIRTIGQTLYKNKGKTIIRIEKSTEKGERTKCFKHFPDHLILSELGIKSLEDLPLIV